MLKPSSSVQAGDIDQELLIFLHIPRTGGSSLEAYIWENYPRDQTLSGDVWGTLNSMNREDRRRIRILIGHVQYGIHTQFPQRGKYLTFLRHPVDRIISLYHFAKTHSEHKFHKRIVEENITIQNFLSSFPDSPQQLFNGQLQAVAGAESATEAALQLAKTNIERHFLFVGVSERYDEGIDRLRQLLGWKTPRERYHFNKASLTMSPDEYRGASEAIIKHNSLDMKLYEYAESRYLGALRGLLNSAVRRVASRRR